MDLCPVLPMYTLSKSVQLIWYMPGFFFLAKPIHLACFYEISNGVIISCHCNKVQAKPKEVSEPQQRNIEEI